MVREAKENEAADKKRKEEAELVNEANQMIFQTKKSLEDLGDKVTEQEKNEANSKMEALQKALDENNLSEVKAKKDDLEKTLQQLATRVYQEAQKAQGNAQQGGDQTGTDAGSQDDAVDADYTEK